MFSQEAVGCTHGMSKTLPLPSWYLPRASLPPARTQPVRQDAKLGSFLGGGEVMEEERVGEVTQLQQSGLFNKKNHI